MSEIPFGQPVARREDYRFVRGRGRYVDDVRPARLLRAAFVRAPMASAAIVRLDTSVAAAMPGVVAVLTGADLDADGIVDSPAPFRFPQGDGSFAEETVRPFLIRERVRFLGEPLAIVVAESDTAAQDAAEAVEVEYDEQPAVHDVLAALEPEAPQLWHERPGNVAFHWRHGEFPQVDEALAASHYVARLKSRISRVSAMPLEPRAALAYVGEDGRPVLRASHQSPHALRDELALVFGLQKDQLRVLAEDVGGSFGMKLGLQREEMLLFWAARRLGRAVAWAEQRTEAFLSDEQARDIYVTSELGLDAQGRFTALKVRYDVGVGAYFGRRSTSSVGNFGGISGVYTTPLTAAEAIGVFTNTQTTAAYRGAGRPEATYTIERLIDVAAAETGIDPAELRRRNLIPPQAMPYKTSFRFTYDCGEFERNLDRALELSGYASFEARRRESAARGRLRGIGMAMPIEMAGGLGADAAKVRVHADGTVSVRLGSMSVGQGHETSLSNLVAQRLEVPLDRIRYEQGDTDLMAQGRGNGGSSALIQGGSAVARGVDDLIEKARRIAASELEVSADDLELAHGGFRVVGTDRSISMATLAGRIEANPQDGLSQLDGGGEFKPPSPTFPNGCHVCEVEVDPQTGMVDVLGYVSVEDVGRVLNPLLVEGQIHGGVAQGVGQALLEDLRHDAYGQLVTGSFMDYAMPRADDLSSVISENLETPTALNPLGVKGVGEAGTVGGLASAMNAICNALQPAGIRHLDMPASPVRVWQALRDAGYETTTNTTETTR